MAYDRLMGSSVMSGRSQSRGMRAGEYDDPRSQTNYHRDVGVPPAMTPAQLAAWYRAEAATYRKKAQALTAKADKIQAEDEALREEYGI